MQNTLAGSFQTAPTFWLNLKNGVSYPIVVQTPQYWMDTMPSLVNMPLTSGGEFRSSVASRQSRAGGWTRSYRITTCSRSWIFMRRIIA